MDAPQYTHLLAALRAVPDPRQARGRRYAWSLLLTLIAAAMASGERNVRAIGQWVAEHAADLVAALDPPRGRLPSTATLRRALRAVDVIELEDRLARFAAGTRPPPLAPVAPPPPPSAVLPPAWSGQAIDGKAVRGANRHGAHLHLVGLVRHADGVVLGQVAVAAKSNELTAAPHLLAGRDLAGTVTTMDALLAQHDLAAQIRRQGGHYLMVVKANQPHLYAAIDLLFAVPPPPAVGDHLAAAASYDKGHGRLERRRLERSAALSGYLAWPDAQQVLRRTCRRVSATTGEISEEATYGVTSLPPAAATPDQLEALWRGHWTIENKVHYVRDVTMGEDACQVRVGHAPQALAALRNGLLNLVRLLGWPLVPDALRHYGAYVHRALALLTTSPPRL
jgi:predicted transposase YbfD/YdcC